MRQRVRLGSARGLNDRRRLVAAPLSRTLATLMLTNARLLDLLAEQQARMDDLEDRIVELELRLYGGFDDTVIAPVGLDAWETRSRLD
jgi:hypothetical protein